MSKQYLIIGGDSKIGQALRARLLRDGKKVIATTRRMDRQGMQYFSLETQSWLPRSDVIYFMTGINGFDACDATPEALRMSQRVNVDLLCYTMRQQRTRNRDAKLIYLSSGAIEVAPERAYAQQKLAAEKCMVELGGVCYRVGPVCDDKGIRISAPEKGRAYIDQTTIYAPIYLRHLVDILVNAEDNYTPHTVHSLYNMNAPYADEFRVAA